MAKKVSLKQSKKNTDVWIAPAARAVQNGVDWLLGGQKPNSLGNAVRGAQELFPDLAHGAEQINAFLTDQPVRKVQRPVNNGTGGAFTGLGNAYSALTGGMRGVNRPAPRKNLGDFGASAWNDIANKAGNLSTGGSDDSQGYNFLNALQQAQDYYNQNGLGAQSVDYSPLIAATQQTYGDASNRLLAMYNALHNSFQNDAGNVGSIFDQAKTADQSAADQATGDINSAYDAARAAQTKQFNDLGIGEALANIVSNGAGTTNADQANALSRVATSNQSNQNQLNTNKSAALNYNTGIANSALQGGTDRAANLQQQLAQQIAQIQQQQQAANNQIQQANMNGVQSLAEDIWNSVLNGQKLSQDQLNNYATQTANQNKLYQQGLQSQISQAIALMKANPGLAFNDALSSVSGAYGQ
jgi:hypothetical protein